MRAFIGIVLWIALSFLLINFLSTPLFIAIFMATVFRFAMHRGHENDKKKQETDQLAIDRGERVGLEYYIYKYVDIILIIIWLALAPAVLFSLLAAVLDGGGSVCIPRGPCD